MSEDFQRDVERLQQGIARCVEAWNAGYDTQGYLHFLQSLDLMESTILTHFDKLETDSDTLVQMLSKLNDCVERKDIMAVQDVVEYEWQPLVGKWETRCAAQ